MSAMRAMRGARSSLFALCAFGGVCAFAGVGASAGCTSGSNASKETAEIDPTPPGRKLYLLRCATCHGPAGDGEGEAAYLLFPKPRNFTAGSFKFRSTPSGTLPTDADLLRTITEGIAGTAMPPAKDLDETSRKLLVQEVKGFSERFKEEEAGTPVVVGQPPAATPAQIAAGKQVYETMQCAACHGAAGRGDGPSSLTLKDGQGLTIRPFDFTSGGVMKGGNTAADIYRTFTTGLDGTPMPSFADSLSEAERWDLVAYVVSLGAGKSSAPVSDVLKAVTVAKIPEDPRSKDWDAIAPTDVGLRSLWLRGGADKITVRVASDRKRIAVNLEWADPIKDDSSIRPQDFKDGIALAFPVKDGPAPFWMGEKANPVNIWSWRSDWQADLKAHRDVSSTYKAMHVDMKPPEDKSFRPGENAGNPMSARARTSSVEDLSATGIGTLTSQPASTQEVSGGGTWADGKWRVTIERPLTTEYPADVQLEGRKSVWVSFAVWDGAAGDRNGQKRVSGWVNLDVEGALEASLSR